MKTFQLDGKPGRLEFTNYDRVDDEILFNGIMKKLEDNPDVIIGSKQTGPSEDYYECRISGLPFTLYYDVDYGPDIHSENQKAIQKLIKYFD